MGERQYSPILPFDITQGENISMYLNTTYTRDITLCGEGSVRKESENLYKYYRCEEIKPVKIGGDRSD